MIPPFGRMSFVAILPAISSSPSSSSSSSGYSNYATRLRVYFHGNFSPFLFTSLLADENTENIQKVGESTT